MFGSNPNLPTIRRKAAEMGAIVVDVREGKKHTIVILRTKDERYVQMQVSRSRIDPYVMEGWTRQAITRRDVFAIVNETANDNEPRSAS